MKFLVINGPNMNMLGKRDAYLYGSMPLRALNRYIARYCKENGDSVKFFQSNHEGDIIDALHNAKADAIIINPAAYTHYSYAIRDAIECINIPVAEVHMSDISSREDFRKKSVISDVVKFTVTGKKEKSYTDAIKQFKDLLCK